MDPSSVLRQQSQNTILRTINEQNKVAAEPKFSKSLPMHSLQHNLEDQGLGRSGQVRPPHPRPTGSRLPVLAKSLHLQIPNEFAQSHCKWDAKPLSGKAKTKKPCTRPVPFNLSQPKASRLPSENHPPNIIHPTRNSKLNKNVSSCQFTTTNRNFKHSATLKENVKSTKMTENSSQLLGKSRPLHSHKTSTSLSKHVSFPLNSNENSATASEQPASAAEACSHNMNLLSLKDTSSILKGDKVDNFQHDQTTLLSILCNEEMSSAVTPQSKPYNYLPQRVSVMKSRQKAESNPGSMKSAQYSPDHGALQSILKNEGVKARTPSDTPMRVPVKKNGVDTKTGLSGTSVKMVQFSPDAAALQSILQNEGVRAVGPDGAAPRNSLCPTGRNTSIYMAQRVPVRKNFAEPNAPLMVTAFKQTPGQKWTPQRVVRHQPTSAMKWHTSSQQSPYTTTPGLRGCKANLCTKQEEVVQKLFVEDEQTTDEVTVPSTESLQDLASCKEKMHSPVKNEEKEDGSMKEDERVEGPFFQAPERESVIFFSTGKKLFRDPCFKKLETTGHKQHGPEEALPVLLQSCHSQTVTKDLLTLKTGVMNPAVAMLRKCLPPLEELRLDEEVATYTSVSVPTVSGFHAPRPRCGNPLATLLHFEESTRFVPICPDLSQDSHHER
ncbi:uncharacterized protein troap isoform X2 [Boleophthalmus pectinirostris]|uniref:uncharacterized protein troap isoform X2 n=1 Tax=Boleophthalmus pectinirostris TaxID=150288 RepID=UPI00242F4920|nr:uncharacterized protein troap isoform X2 [Boleophthalmus pectinirostris]